MTPREVHLIRLSARMAAGSSRALSSSIRSALREGLPPDDLREVALQNYLFLGFPRAINTLALLPPVATSARPLTDLAEWRRRGEALCRRVYGSSFERMMAQMRRLSPDIADWIVWEGYGKVLGRPRLPPHVRELCVLPVLAITGALPQLRAHIRGALNLGATPPEVRRALSEARRWIPRGLHRAISAMRDRLPR